jgi:hypothetical protein
VGIHTWQRTDPPPPIRCPFTSISSSLSACSPVQHSKAYHRTYSLRQPDENCCSASEPVPISKLNCSGSPYRANSTTCTIPQHHRPLGPKTEDGTFAASSIINTTMESTSPAHGSTTSETPASANRTSGHRCFVCSRTYERADHLNRHLKSRKCPSILLKRPDVAWVLLSGQHMLMQLL